MAGIYIQFVVGESVARLSSPTRQDARRISRLDNIISIGSGGKYYDNCVSVCDHLSTSLISLTFDALCAASFLCCCSFFISWMVLSFALISSNCKKQIAKLSNYYINRFSWPGARMHAAEEWSQYWQKWINSTTLSGNSSGQSTYQYMHVDLEFAIDHGQGMRVAKRILTREDEKKKNKAEKSLLPSISPRAVPTQQQQQWL